MTLARIGAIHREHPSSSSSSVSGRYDEARACVLVEARDERRLTALQRRYQKVALLVVDELGFVPFERTGGELLFNLLA